MIVFVLVFESKVRMSGRFLFGTVLFFKAIKEKPLFFIKFYLRGRQCLAL